MSQDTTQNNKRIAKNTLLLYFRLIFTMAVGLFTSRVILNTLGVEDYGVYNVVAGFVTMFSMLSGSLGSAISRFLTYAIGKGEKENLNKVFSTSVTIQLGMAIIMALLMECFGVWFLNSKLNIPDGRMYAANWVFHFAVITFCINLISVPYNAAIIAHERMDAFAYISILEVVLKLIIVYLLYISPFDKLITYAGLFACVSIVIRFVYSWYCKCHFEECNYNLTLDKGLLKEMSGFAGWNLFGSCAYVFNTQGVNIVTNMFFGVTANAARGVANQVEGIVKHFVTNFTTAINPQITKSYAAGNLTYMHSLVCKGAKFTFLLMLLFVVPFMFETETIMKLWLKNYPPEAPLFLRLSMVGTLFDMLGNSTANAAWATGKIKRYYIIIGSVGALVFPLSWICFALGSPAYTSYVIFVIVYFIVMLLKVYIIKGLISFNPMMFFKEVIGKIIPTTIFAFILPSIVYFLMDPSMKRTFVVIICSALSTIMSIYAIGLTKGERRKITAKITNIVKSKIIK